MTAADQLLASLAVRASAFAVCRVAPGWRLRLGAASAPLVHYVLRGTGVLRLADGPAIPFSPHELILLPLGHPQAIEVPAAPGGEAAVAHETAGPESCAALADGLLRFQAGTGGEAPGAGEAVSVCGTVEATYAGSRGLFDRLAAPIQLRLDEADPLRQAFEAMLAELASPALPRLPGAALRRATALQDASGRGGLRGPSESEPGAGTLGATGRVKDGGREARWCRAGFLAHAPSRPTRWRRPRADG